MNVHNDLRQASLIWQPNSFDANTFSLFFIYTRKTLFQYMNIP